MYEKKLLEHKEGTSSTIKAIRTVLAEESYETKQHCDRVSEFCKIIGHDMGLDLYELKELEYTAQIHDIGKIAIRDSILNKKSALTKLEWGKMKMHPEIGYKIVKKQPMLNQVAKYIVAHHERWDGKGYPYGLKGKDIPQVSRIIAVADAFDAMTNNRSYRKALSVKEAIEELIKNAGTQFDSEIVNIFIDKVIALNDFEHKGVIIKNKKCV